MSTLSTNIPLTKLKEETKQNALAEEIIHFYDEATEDYSFWSKDLNMHFGYFDLKRTIVSSTSELVLQEIVFRG